jgi:ParB-like chromosome segregation protein Spo0J
MLIKQDLALSKIIDHPINASIYRDNFDDELVESVRQNGVLSPIVVCKHPGGSYVCLSGHRRRQAAKLAGLTEVPCLMYREDLPEWQQVLIIVESNRQRAKTTEMLARETEALAKAKEQQAAARKKAGKKVSDDLGLNLAAGSEKGRAIVQAAEQTGIGSRMTAEKAIDVVHKIDELEAAGETEAAEELRETLNEKSVSAAHRKAKQPEPEPEDETTGPVILDAFDIAVPAELAEVFVYRDEFKRVLSLLTQVKKAVNELMKTPGGKWLHKTDIDSQFMDLRRAIDFGQPYTVCGMCRGDAKKQASCDGCKHRGFVNEMAYGNQTAEAKEWIKSR